MQMDSIKKESDCLVPSEIYIKMEPEENESELPIVAVDTHFSIKNDVNELNMKTEPTEEEVEHIFFGNHFLDAKKDPDVHGSKSSNQDNGVEEHFPSELKNNKKYKMEATKKVMSILARDEIPNSPQKKRPKRENQMLQGNKQITNKKHICNVCNHTFKCQNHLDIHLRIHNGEKPYECDVCRKTFTTISNFNSHMRTHTGEKPYACDVCNAVFGRRLTLEKHMLIHTGVKPFPCSYCSCSFRQKHARTRHEKTHTGDKPYTCDLCDKSFITKANLDKHKYFHTGEKPFSCDVCNKSFVDKSHLNIHKKTHKI